VAGLWVASAACASVPSRAGDGTGGTTSTADNGRSGGVSRENFDPGARPQDDFYQYVNGLWLERTTIPADRSELGSFSVLGMQAEAHLRSIIDSVAALREPAGTDAQKVGDLYRSFMDTATIEALGVTPLALDLERIRALRSHDELPALFAALRRYGVQVPFGFFVSQDQKQANRYIVMLSQSGLGMPDRDYYLRGDARFAGVRTAYMAYIQRLLQLVGEPDAAVRARQVMALETSLAEAQWDRARNRDRDATYNRMSLAALDTLAPDFSFRAFLDSAGVRAARQVVVRQPDYLQKMDRILADTPIDTWRAYLLFKTTNAAAPFLSTPFVQADFAFHGRALRGIRRDRPRWKRGVDVVSGSLGDVLGRLYVERYFSPEAKARMDRLVGNVLEAFRQGIDSLQWMSPATKAEALAKLAKFTPRIGYPDRWQDYSGLDIEPGDLMGNMRRTAEREYRRMIERLGRPVDRPEWRMRPYTVNAYYSPTRNEIVFPAAILQPPFFNPDADDAVNYGAIGAVIGHEISHGFDDQGRKSDGDGNLRDWWTDADARAFDARAQQLVDQYDRFNPIDSLHVNGRLTLGENIGDLSGLTVAHRAYVISLGGKAAPVINGLTGDQRFFIGWAQIWRRRYRPEELRNRLLTDPHAPSRYRVNGTLANMDEFYAAFGVRPGDAMYLPPDARVKIW
ncbi:MAG: M13-type metalloendopeptidase, partial [Gemmatimonadota bacterium]